MASERARICVNIPTEGPRKPSVFAVCLCFAEAMIKF